MPVCPKCGEELRFHSLRSLGTPGRFYHNHVVAGPYPNSEPHHCELVDSAFDPEGNPIAGSAEERLGLANSLHGHKGEIKPTPISNKETT